MVIDPASLINSLLLYWKFTFWCACLVEGKLDLELSIPLKTDRNSYIWLDNTFDHNLHLCQSRFRHRCSAGKSNHKAQFASSWESKEKKNLVDPRNYSSGSIMLFAILYFDLLPQAHWTIHRVVLVYLLWISMDGSYDYIPCYLDNSFGICLQKDQSNWADSSKQRNFHRTHPTCFTLHFDINYSIGELKVCNKWKQIQHIQLNLYHFWILLHFWDLKLLLSLLCAS